MRLKSETSALILDSWDHYEPCIHDLTVRAFQILFLNHPDARNDVAAIDGLPLRVTDGLVALVNGLRDGDKDSDRIIETLAKTLVHAEDGQNDMLSRYISSYRESLMAALRENAPAGGFTPRLASAWQALFDGIEYQVSQAKQTIVVSYRRSEREQRLGFLVN